MGLQEKSTVRPTIRFSSLSLLLAMTAVAGFYSAWAVHRKQQPLREKVRELQLRVDGMEVSDRSLPHAVILPNSGRSHWEWRVFVPNGIVMNAQLHVEPHDGSTTSRRPLQIQLDPGFNTVVLSIVRSDRDSWDSQRNWLYQLSQERGRGRLRGGLPPYWIASDGWRHGDVRVVGKTFSRAWVGPGRREPVSWAATDSFNLLRCKCEAKGFEKYATLVELQVVPAD